MIHKVVISSVKSLDLRKAKNPKTAKKVYDFQKQLERTGFEIKSIMFSGSDYNGKPLYLSFTVKGEKEEAVINRPQSISKWKNIKTVIAMTSSKHHKINLK